MAFKHGIGDMPGRYVPFGNVHWGSLQQVAERNSRRTIISLDQTLYIIRSFVDDMSPTFQHVLLKK